VTAGQLPPTPGSVAAVTARERRPRRLWYGVAGVLVVAGLAAGVVSGALAGRSAAQVSHAVAELRPQLHPLPLGVPTPVDPEPGRDWAVYVSSSGPTPQVSCGGDGLTVTGVQRDLSTLQDGVRWRQAQLVRVTEPGRYAIVCTSPDRTARFAFGAALDPDATDRLAGDMVGAVLGVLGAAALAALGVLGGGVLALVVGLRRSARRAAMVRLQVPPSP